MTQNELKFALTKCLLEENNSVGFLKKAHLVIKASSGRTGFADLARKMGFSSRSFVRLLFIGERQPNLTNYRQIAQGLGLSSEATQYFGLLIEKEQNGSQGRKNLNTELTAAELKLRKSAHRKVRHDRNTHIISYDRWPFIYAALGTLEKGHNLKEISKLSGESESSCLEILNLLVTKGLVDYDEAQKRYRPVDEMIELGELGQNLIFKRFFKEATLKTLSRVEKEFNNPQSLFYSSVFSVKKKDMPKLTKNLQDILANYASESEDATGDELAVLSTALVPLNGTPL